MMTFPTPLFDTPFYIAHPSACPRCLHNHFTARPNADVGDRGKNAAFLLSEKDTY